MKITIIPSDKAVYIDEQSFINIDWEGTPDGIHALHFDTNAKDGWVEFVRDVPNQTIKTLPDWAENAVAAFNDAKKAHEDYIKAVEELQQQLPTIYAQYPQADVRAVDKLLAMQFTNVTLAPRYRDSDGALIGAQILKVYGEDTGTGTRGLLSIKTATEEGLKLGVPLISNATLPEEKREAFKTYLQSFGHSFVEFGDTIYLYYPWSIELAKAKKNTSINFKREDELAAGVDYMDSKWSIDPTSISNMVAKAYALDSGLDTSNSVDWRNINNDVINMSVSEFKGLVAAAIAQSEQIYKDSWDRKAAVEAATTYEEIEAV